jgi:hypothetical protein
MGRVIPGGKTGRLNKGRKPPVNAFLLFRFAFAGSSDYH